MGTAAISLPVRRSTLLCLKKPSVHPKSHLATKAFQAKRNKKKQRKWLLYLKCRVPTPSTPPPTSSPVTSTTRPVLNKMGPRSRSSPRRLSISSVWTDECLSSASCSLDGEVTTVQPLPLLPLLTRSSCHGRPRKACVMLTTLAQ